MVILRELKQRAEERIGVGLDAAHVILEIYASPRSGTWTIIGTFTSGQTCIITSGYGWEQFEITTDKKA